MARYGLNPATEAFGIGSNPLNSRGRKISN
jgi:hypothetical protein